MKRSNTQPLKRLIAISVALAAIFFCALSERAATRVHAKISPGPPLGFTGAPGEGTCVGCHYTYGQPNPPNSGGKVEITGLPVVYAPGQNYTVTVTVTHPTARAWGFELTAIDSNGMSSSAGALTAANTTTTLKRDSTASGKVRTYFSHNGEEGIAKGLGGSNSWSINWTAPGAPAGDITFYAAGNAANNQVTPEDDYIYTTSVVAKSSANPQTATTVDAASYTTTVAPGQIAALFGTDLVPGNGVAVADSLPLPRSLQGVTVYVNGVAAPLYFAAGSQINYQMPYSTAPGAASVVVLRDDGIAAHGDVNIATAAPALFSADASGKGQAAALNSDFSRNGDPAAAPQAKRARKGDFVILYGSGAGSQMVNATNNQPLALKDGEAATTNPLAATATLPAVTIGGKNSTVYFSGLAPGFVGLWQLNVQVPSDVPSGAAVEVIVNFGGKTANRLTIAVE